MAVIPTRFRIRRDTAARWASFNPVLLDAEPGLETDTLRVKYGDGVTAWNSLPYAGEQTSTDTLTFAPAAAIFGHTLYASNETFALAAGDRLEVEGHVWLNSDANELGVWIGDGTDAVYIQNTGAGMSLATGRYTAGAEAGVGTGATLNRIPGPNRIELEATLIAAPGTRFWGAHEGARVPTSPLMSASAVNITGTCRVYVKTDDVGRCEIRARHINL